jgi:Mrp family chromosome partitioning ATPase
VIPDLDVEAELAHEKGESVSLDQETKEKYTMLLSLFLPKARVVEAFRALRTNLFFSGLERDLKTLMITSSTQMEGKTTVAINLAIGLAQLGKRTLLVEGDLRNPFLHHAFGIPKEPGVAEVVIGSVPLDEAVRSFPDLILGRAGVEGLIDRPGIDNLYLIPSGDQPANPTEFLSAQGMADFLAEVRERYDYVVFDAAPILPVADSTILGAHVDGTLMTVRVGRVARAALRRAKALLEGARAQVLGVCLTGVRAEVSPDYAEMAYYRYRYGPRKQTPTPSVGIWGFLGGELKKRLQLLTPRPWR